jgi:hypothetical protein
MTIPKDGYVQICTIQLLTRSMWGGGSKLPGNLELTFFPQPRNLPKLPRQKREFHSQQYRRLKNAVYPCIPMYTHQIFILMRNTMIKYVFLHHPIWGYHIFGSQNGVLVRCHPSYWPRIPRFMPKRSV